MHTVYVTCFVCQILQTFTEKGTSKVGKIYFFGLKKGTFISDGRKIHVNYFKKYVNFFTKGFYFPSYISPLTSDNCSVIEEFPMFGHKLIDFEEERHENVSSDPIQLLEW